MGGLPLPFGTASLLALLLAISLGFSALFENPSAVGSEDNFTVGAATVVPPTCPGTPDGSPQVGVAWRDMPSLRISLSLSLVCGMVRAALDILLPIWLRARHAYGVTAIAK